VNQTLKATIALVPAVMLLSASAALFSRVRTMPVAMQLLGAAAFVIVALCHLFEGIGALPSMGWGRDDSFGHYLDLSSAVVGAVLFPIGCLLHALRYGRDR
jgi:succinate dehydrogenase/fumarate reductase cytochrome b subunit